MNAIIEQICRGDRRSLARAMSLIDAGGLAADELVDAARRLSGHVPWWGFTGPPGVGKSTLIDALIERLRAGGGRVGVVAIDPTSPISDGAFLGDRVRMMRHAVDENVFIRSLATHRRLGGLSDAALHCARLLELARFDPILVETVGVGQNEADIAAVADICVVLLGPGYGDDIQLIKAGLLEVADLVVVNKCDMPEANRLLDALHQALDVAGVRPRGQAPVHHHQTGPAPATDSRRAIEVLGIEARSGIGVDALLSKLLEFDRTARAAPQRDHHRRRRIVSEFKRNALARYQQRLDQRLAAAAGQELIAQVERGELLLSAAVEQLGGE